MLYDTVQFEGELKEQLENIFKPYERPKTPYLTIANELSEYLKLGVKLYRFEKEFKATSLKLNSNSKKQERVPSQLNEKVFKEKENLWECVEDMVEILKKKYYKTNFLCLLMAYKIKMAIAKTHPEIFNLLKQSRGQEGKLKLLDTLDEERILFIQYAESNLNP
ncbi:hypothetical protein HMI56_006515 [Coelomomyces lativittatus]|nr:hypothetical protein HMI56_006515 [Coelomomyces lativittatus]